MLNQIRSLDSLKPTPSIKQFDHQIFQEKPVATSSSYRASIRRMRCETFVQPNVVLASSSQEEILDHLLKQVEQLSKQIDLAMRDGRYSDALLHLKEIEKMIDANKDKLIDLLNPPTSVELPVIRSMIDHLETGLLSTSRAYFLGLNGDSNAVSLCDIGFENLELAAKELETISKGSDGDSIKIKQSLKTSHLLMRGMLEICLNSQESAIKDLKAGFVLAIESDLELGVGLPFLIKVLEQKFQAPLLPSLVLIDKENPDALILAGRYEEALNLLSTRFKDQLAYEGKKAVCLALMGKHDKALEIFNKVPCYWDDLDRSFAICLVQILKNDYEKAREIVKAPATDPFFAVILLLVIHGSEKLT